MFLNSQSDLCWKKCNGNKASIQFDSTLEFIEDDKPFLSFFAEYLLEFAWIGFKLGDGKKEGDGIPLMCSPEEITVASNSARRIIWSPTLEISRFTIYNLFSLFAQQ